MTMAEKAKAVEPELDLVIGDKAYKGKPLQAAASQRGVRFEVVDQKTSRKTFVPIKHRWKVERSIAWHGRHRRLSRDYERTVESSEGVMNIASIGILLRRTTRQIPRETG